MPFQPKLLERELKRLSDRIDNLDEAESTAPISGNGGGADPNAALAAHVADSDPHTGYQKESEKGAASGYAPLDSGLLVPVTNLPAATTTAKGTVELATSGENAASVVVQGNDARLSDARTPSAHKTSHEPGGADALTALTDASIAAANKDGAAGTASLRTIGSGATQAMAGATRLDQVPAPTASVSLNSQKITNLATPTADTDAATKAYADSASAGLDPHPSVKVATTANITLSGTQTIDGVAVVATDRVLVKDQTTTTQNGIYVVAAGAWSRATDADTGAELTGGTFTFVEQGTVNSDKGFVATHNGTPVLGTDPVTFSLFSGGGGNPTGPAGGVLGGTYPNPTFAADMATQAELDAHAVAADPHTVYQKESEKAAASGYASLDAGTKVPAAQLPDATTTAKGAVELATSGENAANVVVQGNDSRLSDARAPSGTAGGVLSGTYPNPGFAADMATQAELDAGLALKASLASPVFTGNPTAPTPATSDNDTSVATTAMVQAAVDADIATHAAAADPHTGYQKETEKGAASGYASLDAGTKVPVVQLGSGTASATTFLRGDQTYATPVSSGIQSTIVDVKGDLIAATAADTVARQPVGSNYTLLKSDSAQTTGLRWAFDTVVNVADYGTVTDGTGNNSTAFANAIAACAAQGGGTVLIPSGRYRFTAGITMPGGVELRGVTAALKQGADAYARETVALIHDFSGDFVVFAAAVPAANGGGLRDLLLLNKSTRTGTAIKAAAVSGDAVAPSRVWIDNVTVSGYDGAGSGWTRDVWLDGTNGTLDIRQWWFTNCQFFGCTTAGETVRITRAAAIFFNNCGIYPAPESATQGLKVEHANSANIFWTGGTIGGDVSTAAAPTGATQPGLVFQGAVEGSVTFAAGASRNTGIGFLSGSVTYTSTDKTNYWIKQGPAGLELIVRSDGTVSTNGTLSAPIMQTAGASGGFVSYDRNGDGNNWAWYRQGGVLRFFENTTSTDQFGFVPGSASRAWMQVPVSGSFNGAARFGHKSDRTAFMSANLLHDGTNWAQGDNLGEDASMFWLESGTDSYCSAYTFDDDIGALFSHWTCSSDFTYPFAVNGACHASSFPTSSDARLKKDVKEIERELGGSVLDRVLALRPVAYSWKKTALPKAAPPGDEPNGVKQGSDRSGYTREVDKGGATDRNFGFIAQEVEEILPDLVTRDSDDKDAWLALDYGRMVPVLVAALQEETAARKALEQRVAQLEAA